MTACVNYYSTGWQHGVDFLSEEHSGIIHGGSGLICARYKIGPLSRIWWDWNNIECVL